MRDIMDPEISFAILLLNENEHDYTAISPGTSRLMLLAEHEGLAETYRPDGHPEMIIWRLTPAGHTAVAALPPVYHEIFKLTGEITAFSMPPF